MKIELTIATGKQFENIHVSEEIEAGNWEEATAFAEQAEEKFHNCFIGKDTVGMTGLQVEQKPVKGGSEKEITFEKVNTSIPKE